MASTTQRQAVKHPASPKPVKGPNIQIGFLLDRMQSNMTTNSQKKKENKKIGFLLDRMQSNRIVHTRGC